VVANNVAIAGVFAGCEYTDLNGRHQVSPFYTSGLSILANTVITVYIWDDPAIIYQVQADGQFNTGLPSNLRQSNITNFSAGNATTGISQATVSATPVATTVQGQWQIVSPSWDVTDNYLSDPYTDLWVQIARAQNRAVYVSI
jgi:hypothetical protein